MKISSLIFEYLIEYDHVNISGFGVFSGESKDAYIHPIDHSFIPADKKINFRLDKNTIDDGFLSFVSNKLNISVAESKTKLKEAINDWIKRLRAGEEITMENLGIIKINASKTVIFVEAHGSIDKNYFGLQDFKMEPLEKIKPTPLTSKTITTKDKERKRPVLIWVAAAMLLIIAGGFWFFRDNFIGQKIAEKPPIKENLITPTTHKEDSLQQKEQKKSEIDTSNYAALDSLNIDSEAVDNKAIVDVEQEKEIESATVENHPAKGNHYFVVAGCFRSAKKADDFMANLQERGYGATIEGKTSGGLIRVCYGAYPSWNEAVKAASLISEKEHASAWVQKIIN